RLCLIRLEPLDSRTLLCAQCGGQDRPARRVFRGEQGLWVPMEARADRHLGGLGLRRPASPRPLFRGADGCYMRVEPLRAPGARRAAPPSLPTACIVAEGRLGGGRTGPPAGFPPLAVLRGTPNPSG